MLYSWKDGKSLSAPLPEKLHSNRLHGLGLVHVLQEVSGSPRLAATWEAWRWEQLHAASFKTPVWCAQPVAAESGSLLGSKAVCRRDRCSRLLEKAKGDSLRRRVDRTWSSRDKVHRTLVSIIKALKSLPVAFVWMVQVSWMAEFLELIPNFSLKKSAEGNHSG